MRELKFGETMVQVKASPLTPFLYKKEFNSDLLTDLMGMQKLAENPEKLDLIILLQIAYILAKTAAYGKDFPNFEGWLASLETVDFGNNDFLMGIFGEAMQGLFRSGAGEFQKHAADSSRKI